MKRLFNVKCGFGECKEWGHYETSNRKEYEKLSKKYGGGKYRCVRHTDTHEVLGLNNLKVSETLISEKKESGLYWNGFSGFAHGNGYKAYSNDFPEGTKLVVVAEIILPTQQQK